MDNFLKFGRKKGRSARKGGFAGFGRVLAAVVLIAALAIMLKTFLSSQKSQLAPEKVTDIPNMSPIPTTDMQQPTQAITWRSYSDCTYAFEYPPSWSVKGTYDTYYEGQVTSIASPKGNVVITLYPQSVPYGFGNGLKPNELQRRELTITIEGKDYIGTEIIILNYKAFTDLRITKDREYHIVFGTGYPASDDRTASLSDYFDARTTILSILTTLKIDNHHPGC